MVIELKREKTKKKVSVSAPKKRGLNSNREMKVIQKLSGHSGNSKTSIRNNLSCSHDDVDDSLNH